MQLVKRPSIDADFSSISAYVDFLRGQKLYCDEFALIDADFLNFSALATLVDSGWSVAYWDCYVPQAGLSFKRATVYLPFSVRSYYERDKVLFHELVHAAAPDFFDDRNDANCALVVEYYARQKRADSLLLAYAVTAFRLQPAVYDAASFAAFGHDTDSVQLVLPGSLPLLMD